jgi:hypothetical protein
MAEPSRYGPRFPQYGRKPELPFVTEWLRHSQKQGGNPAAVLTQVIPAAELTKTQFFRGKY